MVEDCLFLWVVFFISSGYHCLEGELNLINVNSTDNVLIECSVGINVSLTRKRWHFEENLLYTGVQRISDMGTGRIDLLQNNYSLSITRVSLSDEGNYTCTVNGTRQRHRLTVNVHPRSFYIHVGGINLTTGSYLPIKRNETLTISCHVIGVRPENKIDWLVDNVTVDESVEFHSAKDREDPRIFNAHSILQFHPIHRRGTLTCVRRTADSHIHGHLHLPFSLYEPPTSFFMTINGSNVSDRDHLLIEASAPFEVKCQVGESAPANNISWVVGNETKYSPLTYLRYEDSSEETFFNTSSSLDISIGSINETLACVRRAPGEAVAIEVYFTTFARAQMNLIINEDRSLRDISVNEGDYMLILCEATGSRPTVELSITVNTEKLSESVELINKSSYFNEDLQTFDSMMEVLYIPAYENGTVICSCEGTGCPTKSEIKRFYTAAEGRPNMDTSFNYFLLTIGTAITTFSFAFVIVFSCVKAVLRNASQLLPTPLDRDATTTDSVKLNTLRKYKNTFTTSLSYVTLIAFRYL